MKPSVWIPAAFTPVYLLGAYVAGALASRGSWINIAVPAMLLIGVPSVLLLWVAWGLLSWRAAPRAASRLVLAGIFLPFVVGGLALVIAKLIEAKPGEHAGKKYDESRSYATLVCDIGK